MPFTLPIGAAAPGFDLPGTDGKRYALAHLADARVLVVVFSCNHCPYVIGSEDRMVAFANEYAPRGVWLVAVNPNETDGHSADSFEHIVARARDKRFPFPYLRDEDQPVAREYGALRTPHYYAFAKDAGPRDAGGVAADGRVVGGGPWRLRYTGRMDNNPRTPGAETTRELADAVDALLAGREPPVAVTNPIGCNVKWRGRPRKWMPPEACDLA